MADFFCLDLRQVLTDVQAEGGKDLKFINGMKTSLKPSAHLLSPQ